MGEMKGLGGNLLNHSQQSRFLPFIIVKQIKNKEGLAFLLGEKKVHLKKMDGENKNERSRGDQI